MKTRKRRDSKAKGIEGNDKGRLRWENKKTGRGTFEEQKRGEGSKENAVTFNKDKERERDTREVRKKKNGALRRRHRSCKAPFPRSNRRA